MQRSDNALGQRQQDRRQGSQPEHWQPKVLERLSQDESKIALNKHNAKWSEELPNIVFIRRKPMSEETEMRCIGERCTKVTQC